MQFYVNVGIKDSTIITAIASKIMMRIMHFYDKNFGPFSCSPLGKNEKLSPYLMISYVLQLLQVVVFPFQHILAHHRHYLLSYPVFDPFTKSSEVLEHQRPSFRGY